MLVQDLALRDKRGRQLRLKLGLLVVDHMSHDLGNCLELLVLTLVARDDKPLSLDH